MHIFVVVVSLKLSVSLFYSFIKLVLQSCRKGACSEIIGKWNVHKTGKYGQFPTNISSKVKKIAKNVYLICKQFVKTMVMLLLLYK